MLKTSVEKAGSEVWAWCLMPNHVHLIIVPSHEDGLRQSVAVPHRKYAARINARNKWTGHFWQGRYGSVVMDEEHLVSAFAYISLNPVRAGLVEHASHWKWSSVHAHLTGKHDGITKIAPALSRIADFAALLGGGYDLSKFEAIRGAEVTGRPVGTDEFVEGLELKLGRILKPGKRGPRPGTDDNKE